MSPEEDSAPQRASRFLPGVVRGSDYAALCASAATVNQLNAVHTALDRRLTPLERAAIVSSWNRARRRRFWASPSFALSELAAGARRVFPGGAAPRRVARVHSVALDARSRWQLQQAWITTLEQGMHAAQQSPPAPFRRVLDNGVVQLFQLSEEPSSRVLVAFTGKQGRVMMALPDFLQHSHDLGVDIAVISVPELGSTYWDSIPGYSSGLETLLARVAHDLSGYSLTDSSVMGASLGSIPAVVAGLLWRAKTVVAVGTFRPGAELWVGPLRRIMDGLTVHDATGSATRFIFVYGHDSWPDKKAALNFAALLGGETVPVEDAGHNPLYPLVQRGQFTAWLLRVLSEGEQTAPSRPSNLE